MRTTVSTANAARRAGPEAVANGRLLLVREPCSVGGGKNHSPWQSLRKPTAKAERSLLFPIECLMKADKPPKKILDLQKRLTDEAQTARDAASTANTACVLHACLAPSTRTAGQRRTTESAQSNHNGGQDWTEIGQRLDKALEHADNMLRPFGGEGMGHTVLFRFGTPLEASAEKMHSLLFARNG